MKTTKVFITPWISVIVTMSPLATCATSWPSTASTSSLLIDCSRPVETATSAEFLLLGADETNDLAVLKVEARSLPVATLGNSDQLIVGEWAIATNYAIQRFSRNMLFDEKIGGTIHLALGRGFPEVGGKTYLPFIGTCFAT